MVEVATFLNDVNVLINFNGDALCFSATIRKFVIQWQKSFGVLKMETGIVKILNTLERA